MLLWAPHGLIQLFARHPVHRGITGNAGRTRQRSHLRSKIKSSASDSRQETWEAPTTNLNELKKPCSACRFRACGKSIFEAHWSNRTATRIDMTSTRLSAANLSEQNFKLNELRVEVH